MSNELETILARQTQIMEAMLAMQKGGQMVQANAWSRPSSYKAPQRLPQVKHSSDMITMPPPDLSTEAGVYEYFPIYDERGPYHGFFQDPALRGALMNLMVFPVDGLANDIPIRANNRLEDKYGFIARYDIRQKDGQSEGGVCDPAPYLESDLDFIKMHAHYGKLARSMNTMDVTNLILQASAGQFDQFYIVGQWRGVSDTNLAPSTFVNAAGGINEGLIRASAVRRKLFELGTYFQQWVLNKVWTGDVANSGTQTKEFNGIYKLVNGKYSTSGLPLEVSQAGVNTPANLLDSLSSIVVNVDKTIGDGTWSSWRTLMNVERLLHQRAAGTGMLPVQWKIYMTPMMWSEMIKHIACEMVADGCTIPGGSIEKQFHLNDGGTALYNLTTRQALENAQALTLNGRTYPVVLDETMPYTVTTDEVGNFTGYKSDIFFIPFTVAGGEQVLYWEYIDYSQMYNFLAPIGDRASDAKGWTDNGQYYHQITTLRSCVELQTEMQMRLIFRAPQLAARLDNISYNIDTEWPLPWDGSGNRTSWLIPPTES